ncbi:Glycosyltransferase family 61 protein [Abeliophyllum distichum]|uniref:Glycosyltransferase family 61 protein n=1 Tax=Abeliophyllum distichum TaxID=126358 RepID=A0ABD1VCJ5_9LAMI
MVKYQKNNQFQWKKTKEDTVDEDEDSYLHPFALICTNSGYSNKRAIPKLFFFIFLFLLSCTLFLAPHLFSSNSITSLSFFYSFGVDNGSETDVNTCLCSSVPNGTICCDRSSIRSDICIMIGDVRTHSVSSSIFLYRATDPSGYLTGLTDDDEDEYVIQHEKIRPYTRKWEPGVMDTIAELDLVVKRKDFGVRRSCDVVHDVPALFFSTGGYTGNLYHEFNDGILPLYITSQHLNKKVVFVILEYHNWWITKYGDILSQLSDFPAVEFHRDKRVHCFPKAIVGLRIHDELTIETSLMENHKTIGDFRDLLDRAYWPRIRGLIQDKERKARLKMEKSTLSPASRTMKKPKLVIISRNGSRAITNEDSLVKMAKSIGFLVEVLKPKRTTELAKVYRLLNSSDVMVGVHGAALTHFLFMRPGSVFIQVVPLGSEWAAGTFYAEPSQKLGLKYIGYKILPKESSLYIDYDKNDPILIDPSSVNKKGWEFTKKIYLDRQMVRLNLRRFRKRLLRAYYYSVARKNKR